MSSEAKILSEDCFECESDNSDNYISDEDDSNADNTELTNCLFCSDTLPSVETAISHLYEKHEIDLFDLKCRFNMDQYCYIKFINYIRANNVTPEEIKSINSSIWQDEKYLKPGDYEPWLTFDFEEWSIDKKSSGVTKIAEKANAENVVETLNKKIKEKDELLLQAMEDINKLRSGFKRFLEKDDLPEKSKNSVANISLEADEGYFSSYAHYGIHYEMLSDAVRTKSYRNAMLDNKEVIEKKLVLDLGCGTSVLSMFASQAGAETVVAVDNSEIIFKAMEIANKNKFDNIKFIKGRLEDTELPIDKFDIIISEWMGYFLIFEGMLDSVIYARDNHLKPGGILMPNRCTINLCGYGDINRHNELIGFWDSVYGLDMSSMKKEVLQEPLIEICNPEFILTDTNVIADYNLYEINLKYSNFEFDFKLKCKKNGKLTAFVAHFDTFFDLPSPIYFSTSASDIPTHWKQVVFLLETPMNIVSDQIIDGKIIVNRCKKDLRTIDVNLKVFNKVYTYFLN